MNFSCSCDNCANCAIPFDNEKQMFNKFTLSDESDYSESTYDYDIAVLDAVLYIYGFSAVNLVSAYVHCENDDNLSSSATQMSEVSSCITNHGIFLCSNCISMFKEVYVAYHHLKKLSNEAAILTKAIKKFSPPSIKYEVPSEENCDNSDNFWEDKTAEVVSKDIPNKPTGRQPMHKKIIMKEEQRHKRTLKFLSSLINIKRRKGWRKRKQTMRIRLQSYLQKHGLTDGDSEIIDNNQNTGISKIYTKVTPEENFITIQNATDGDDDIFDDFNFEHYGDHEEDEEDKKTDLFSETKSTDDILATSETVSNNNDDDGLNHAIISRQGCSRSTKTTSSKKLARLLSKDFTTKLGPSVLRSGRTRKTSTHSVLPKNDDSDFDISTSDMNSESIRIGHTECRSANKQRIFHNRKKHKRTLKLIPKKKGRKIMGWTTQKYRTGKATLGLQSHLQNFGPADANSVGDSDCRPDGDANSSNENHDKEIPSNASTSNEKKVEPKFLNCICGKILTSLDSLRRHEEKYHAIQDPVVCEICSQSFEMNYLLYAHKDKEHYSDLPPIQNFKCKMCHYNFQTQKSLQAHLDHQLCRNAPKILQCTCGESFSSLRALRNHERKHGIQNPLICDICGESFAYKYLLYAHKSRDHSELPQILIKCDLCETKFISKPTLIRHMQHCHSINPQTFICEIYGNSHQNRSHKDEGLDKELFKCKECGKSLIHSYSLKRHMKIVHNNQKTFVCEQCGKTTKNMTNMRIHMVVHDPNRVLKLKPSTSTPTASESH